MTTEELHNFKVDNEEIEVVQDFLFLGSIIKQHGDCNEEIRRRLRLGRAAVRELDKILKDKDVSLGTKIKIIQTMVFPIAMYGCESWMVKKADRKKIDSFEMWCWRRVLWIPWTAKKTNKWVLDQIKPEFFLKAKMIKLRLLYLVTS